jgi:hypothetical protein
MWEDQPPPPDHADDAWLEGSVDQPLTDWGRLPRPDEDDHPFDVSEQERYRWVSDVARGGMGRIDSVEDLRLGRVVARKRSLRSCGDSVRAERRMSREAWITAQLEHPGIVAVHNVGRDDGGGLFFTMRLVRGTTLTSALKSATGCTDRLALVRHLRDASEAVGFAHRQGVVHRDLKPANIMVGRFGETQVMDWGLATPVPGAEGDWWRERFPPQLGVSTVQGAVVGTAWYLSPEQVSGGEVGPTSDVWSLGVILYELLSGTRPFQGTDFRAITTRIAAGRPAPLSALDATVPPGLVEICSRALSPCPSARYRDGKALADALTAWMTEGVGTVAPPVARRRGRGPAYAVALGAGVLVMAGWAHTQHLEQATALASAQQQTAELAEALGEARASLALMALDAGRHDAAAGLAHEALALGPAPGAVGVLMATALSSRASAAGTSQLPPCTERAVDRSGRWLVCTTVDAVQRWTLAPLALDWSVALSGAGAPQVVADGTVLVRTDRDAYVLGDAGQFLFGASVGGDGHLVYLPGARSLWKADHDLLVAGGEGLDFPQHHRNGEVRWAMASECGHLVAAAEDVVVTSCGTDLRVVHGGRVRQLAVPEFADQQHVEALATDGHSAWMGGGRGGLARVDLQTGHFAWQVGTGEGAVQSITPDADGQRLMVRHDLDRLRVVDARSGAPLVELEHVTPGAPVQLAGDTLHVYGDQHHRFTLSSDTVGPRRLRPGHGVTALAFGPDGSALAVGHGRGLQRYRVHDGALEGDTVTEAVVKDVAWSRADVLYAAMPAQQGAGGSETWNLLRQGGGGPVETRRMARGGFRRLALLGDEHLIYTSYSLGPWSWNVDTWAAGPRVAQLGGLPTDLEGSSDGRSVAWVGTEGVWALSTDDMVPVQVLDDAQYYTIAPSPDGERAFIGASDHLGCVWLRDSTPCWPGERSLPSAPIDLASSPDGRLVAAGLRSGETLVMSGADGTVLARLGGHSHKVSAVAFAPDGALLATGSWDGTVQLWSTAPLETDGVMPALARSDALAVSP